MSRLISGAAALSVAFLVTGCLTGGGHGGEGLPTSQDAVTYTTVGSTIILGPKVTLDKSCDGDQLVTRLDTSDGDTAVYTQSGNTLNIFTPVDTVESGAVTRLRVTFMRGGKAVRNGLEGSWSFSDVAVDPISGTFSDSEQQSWDKTLAQLRWVFEEERLTLTFSGGIMTTSLTHHYAEEFINDWNGGISGGGRYVDSANYEIDVKPIGANTVQMTGRRSGEIVTLTFSAAGDMTFSSSQAAHETTTFFRIPVTCPNIQPQWYTLFLENNAKVSILQKQGRPEKGPQPHHNSLKHGIFPFLGAAL